MLKSLKKLVPFDAKLSILLILYQFKSLKSFSFKIPIKNSKRIFIFLAADYGNLGDVAITYAQHKFLQQSFPDYLVTEIPISKTIEGVAFVKKIVSKQDIITTVGGGNMGDLYPMIESFRQLVITNFKKNLIISFPQTIDFSKTPSGKKALKKAMKIYSRHNNLILLAREKITYDFFVTNFKSNKPFLVPDIVMTLNKSEPIKERRGVIICLRNDKEKKLNNNQENRLLTIVDSNFDKKKRRDTHIGGEQFPLFKRVKELHNIWNNFRRVCCPKIWGYRNDFSYGFLYASRKIVMIPFYIKKANLEMARYYKEISPLLLSVGVAIVFSLIKNYFFSDRNLYVFFGSIICYSLFYVSVSLLITTNYEKKLFKSLINKIPLANFFLNKI